MYYAVRVNIESNFDLWDSSGCGCDAVQSEHTELLVVLSELTLALQNVYINCGLVIRISRECLSFLGRYSGVSLDHLGSDAACGLDAQRKRSYVEQQQTVFNVAAEDTALICSAESYALVRVDALERLFADEVLYSFLYSRYSRRTAYHQYLVEVVYRKSRVRERLAYRAHSLFYEVCGHLVELSLSKGQLEVLRAVSRYGDVRQADSCGSGGRKLYLSQLSLCL